MSEIQKETIVVLKFNNTGYCANKEIGEVKQHTLRLIFW